MHVFHLFLLLLFVGPSWSKPLEDDDPGNKDAAPSDPPPDAGNGDGGDGGDKAANADGGGGNGDNAAPSDDGDKKDKEGNKSDAGPAVGDISPADDKGGDDKGDKKPTDAPTPTPTGKTPSKTPTPTGKTPTPTKGPTSKPTTAAADNKDKVADDAPSPTTGATTNKPTSKHTSPSPRSSTKAPKSTPNPTIIKKASIPSSPKPTTAATTKAKTTAATTQPTTPAPTRKPTKAATSKAPETDQDADQRSKIYRNNDGYGQTVEKSNNNTLKMNGTTFRVAVRLLEEKWTEDLNYQKNPVFQSLKKTVMSAVAVVYDGYHDFKQIAIIGFTETPANDSDADKRDSIVGNSVIADFYLRFFSFGKHLKKLTDAVKNEKIGTLTVSPKFVKAYTAEPRGRVCTPDCKSKCYAYCDKGCCNENSLMQRTLMQHRQQQQQQQQQQKKRQQQSSLGVIPPRSTICRDLDLACLLGTEPRFADPPPAAPIPPAVSAAKKFAVSGPAQRRSNTCSGPQCLLKYALNPPAQLPNVKQCHGDIRCETRLVNVRKNVVGKSPPTLVGNTGSMPDFFQNTEPNRASFMVKTVADPMESHLVRNPGPNSIRKLFSVDGPSVAARTNILGRPYSPFFPRGRAPVFGGGGPFTRHIQNIKQQLMKNKVVPQVPRVPFTLNND